MNEIYLIILGGALSIIGSIITQYFIYHRKSKEAVLQWKILKAEKLIELLAVTLPVRLLEFRNDVSDRQQNPESFIDFDMSTRAILRLYFPRYLQSYEALSELIIKWQEILVTTAFQLPNTLSEGKRKELYLQLMTENKKFLDTFTKNYEFDLR